MARELGTSNNPNEAASKNLMRLAKASTFLGAIGVILIGIRVALKGLPAAEGGVVTAAILVAIILLLATFTPPEQIASVINRIKALNFGSFLNVELNTLERLAQAEETKDLEYATSLMDLKIRVERQLTYMAKHVLAYDPKFTPHLGGFVTVGSLNYDKLLTDSETKIAYDVLGMREFEFRELPEKTQLKCLDGWNAFARWIRGNIFAALVRERLKDWGWAVNEFDTNNPHRRDLFIQKSKKDSPVHQVVPLFGAQHADYVKRRISTDGPRLAEHGGQTFIVVPPATDWDPSPIKGDDPDTSGIKVVDLTKLREVFGP